MSTCWIRCRRTRSSGTGSSANLAGELLKSVARIDVLHVPYKGVAPALLDLMAGRVTFSFSTGIVEGLGTPWGLLRNYWVVTKLVLTVIATLLLLLHTQPIDRASLLAGSGGAVPRVSAPVAATGMLGSNLVLARTAALRSSGVAVGCVMA